MKKCREGINKMGMLCSFSDEEQKLIDKGYIMIREYNPFGHAPCFKNPKTSDILFVFNEIVYTTQTMYEYLESNWIPISEDDMKWKINCMHKYFFGGVK